MYSHALCSRQQCLPDFDNYVWVSNMKGVIVYPKRKGLVNECTNVFLKLCLAYVDVQDTCRGCCQRSRDRVATSDDKLHDSCRRVDKLAKAFQDDGALRCIALVDTIDDHVDRVILGHCAFQNAAKPIAKRA
jgi:hypothetical protein